MRFGYEAATKIASNPDPPFATSAARSAPAASSTVSMSAVVGLGIPGLGDVVHY